MLVDAKLLTEEQLRMAIEFQKSVGGKLGAIIVKLGFLEEKTLTNFIAKQQNLKVVNLSELVLPENLVHRVPQKLIEEHCVMPIHYAGGVLTVATSDPYDFEALEALQLALDYRVEINLAPRSDILKCINEIFYREEGEVSLLTPEKSKEDLLRELEQGVLKGVSTKDTGLIVEALIALLVEKEVVAEEDLVNKIRGLEENRKELEEESSS